MTHSVYSMFSCATLYNDPHRFSHGAAQGKHSCYKISKKRMCFPVCCNGVSSSPLIAVVTGISDLPEVITKLSCVMWSC